MSGPSDKAIEAGAAAFDLDADHRRNTELVLDAAHDPALGLHRSVCLGDVIKALHVWYAVGGDREAADLTAAEFVEREFGGRP